MSLLRLLLFLIICILPILVFSYPSEAIILKPFGVEMGSVFKRKNFKVLSTNVNQGNAIYKISPNVPSEFFSDYNITVETNSQKVGMLTAIIGRSVSGSDWDKLLSHLISEFGNVSYQKEGEYVWAFKGDDKLNQQKAKKVKNILNAGKLEYLPLADQLVYLQRDLNSYLAVLTVVDLSIVRDALAKK